jgi:hypothetical protein
LAGPVRQRRPYQDLWRGGRKLASGGRECAGRYDLLAATLPLEPFSLLDVGAYTGYFSVRVAEEFPATVTAVDDCPGLADAAGERVIVIPRRLRIAELYALARHDVVLALSVLHHFADWRAALRALLACRSHLIIEICDPQERWMRSAASRRDVAAQHQTISMLPGAEQLGFSPRIGRDGITYQRPIYRLPGTIQTLTGEAFTGSGWCSRNMPRYDVGLGAKLGYEPFPGSLNVRLPAPHSLGQPALNWSGARSRDRQFWRAWVGELACHAHVPGKRNHGPDVLELVAPVKLRERFGIVDGDPVTFDVEVGQ